MESRIRKIQHMLRDPDIVEAPDAADAVGPGMLVTVTPLDFDDEDDETYLIAEHAEEKAPGRPNRHDDVAVRRGADGRRRGRRGRLRGARVGRSATGSSRFEPFAG